MAALAQAALIGKGNQVPSASECGNLCFKQLRRSYEPKLGGFSEAPKFPQPVNMNFLLRWHVLNKGSDADLALDMCAHTLHMMAKGGIFDHVSLVRKSIILSVDVLFHTYIYFFFNQMARVSHVTRPMRNGTCHISKRCYTIKLSWLLFILTPTF